MSFLFVPPALLLSGVIDAVSSHLLDTSHVLEFAPATPTGWAEAFWYRLIQGCFATGFINIMDRTDLDPGIQGPSHKGPGTQLKL